VKNEKVTDIFISKLLEKAKIEYSPNSSNIKEINEALKTSSKKGTNKIGYPEFIAKSDDFIIVIEDKADTDKQVKLDENGNISTETKAVIEYAENGALHYAKHIIENSNFKKVFAFGCSGDEKHHIIKPIFVDETGYTVLKPIENFENFNPKNIERYYKEQVLDEKPIEIQELEKIKSKAKELHEHLRNYGQLGETEKPLVVSAILLALQEETFSLKSLNADSVKTDGEKIFDALSTYMVRVQVQPETKKEQVLNQFIIVKDRTVLNKEHHHLGKTPLKYFTEYIKDNILKAIMNNTNEDVLGNFYGEFIKYSGGDGQTLGVVLTPSHITEIFCDLIEIDSEDKVLDPCCGTGAFLITAMNQMIEKSKSSDEVENIKKNQIHGVEIREDMFSIATTNMILRGDGKSNLLKDDFLSYTTESLRAKNFTVGFMNPPYSQAKGKDTAHLSEISFIKHLLDGLADNGRAVVIVPQSTMVGKSKDDKKIKKEILKHHTLEGVITLNKNTFYGVGTNPCIAVFTAHKPHHERKNSKFINYENDGFVVNKHSGLVKTELAKSRKQLLLDCWLHDAQTETKFMVKTTVKAEDEWLHSFYYFNDEIPKDNDFDKTVTDYLSFEFNMIMQGREYLFGNTKRKMKNFTKFDLVPISEKHWKPFLISDVFEIKSGKRLTKSDMKLGDKPFIGATDSNNGITAFTSDINNSEASNLLGVNYDGSVGEVFYHPYKAIFSDSVKKLKVQHIVGNKEIYLFLKQSILQQKVKYQYGYKFNANRMKRQKILLPINSENKPDFDFMEKYIKNLEFSKLEKYLDFVAEV